MKPWPSSWLLASLVAALAGCPNNQQVVVPNRVLDRPLDVALMCVNREGNTIEILALNQCSTQSSDDDGAEDGAPTQTASDNDCDEDGSHLLGFVANSERNELALFRRCDRQSALVDLDPEAPGYSFVPVGDLPTRVATTDGSCHVVTANAGSCDLTVAVTLPLAARAFAIDYDSPSTSGLSTVVPRRSDGEPLGALIGDMIAAPDELSLAARAGGGDGAGESGGESGGGTTGGDGGEADSIDSGGGGGGLFGFCPSSPTTSVYVTFPACQLVAEVALDTQVILQSRRVETAADGTITLVDAGTAPDCPVECPAQFDVLPERAMADITGMFPSTLALVAPDGVGNTSEWSLIVGGPGSDSLIEIDFDLESGQFVAPTVTPQLLLENPSGVTNVRVSPRVFFEPDSSGTLMGDERQYVFAVAGDGSTHVVSRAFDDPEVLGVECDTQIDPSQVSPTLCHEIDPAALDNASLRRPFAEGPGIRIPGSVVADWAFQYTDPTGLGFAAYRSPFSAGLIAIGATSIGGIAYVVFDQYLQFPIDTNRDLIPADPLGIMDVQVPPMTLWPDTTAGAPQVGRLPRVSNEEPGRDLPDEASDARTLAPHLRRIDLAYAGGGGNVSEEQQSIADRLDGPNNVDALGSFQEDSGYLYSTTVPRVVARDYELWGPSVWELAWNGVLPGTPSTTGVLACDHHGGTDDNGNTFAGGTCRASEPDDARVSDDAATLCDDGVLAGDTLLIPGCLDDEPCDLGQRCLRSATSGETGTGICVSELEYEQSLDDLRRDCAPFISDPCGGAVREFRITRVTQHEMWLAAIDRAAVSLLRDMDPDEEVEHFVEYEGKLSCAAPVPHREPAQTCIEDAECQDDPYSTEEGTRSAWRCEAPEGSDTGACEGRQPEGGCTVDEDCRPLGRNYVCHDDLCRAPCNLCPMPNDPDASCITDADCGGEAVCFVGTCHVACEDDNPGCIETPLPGPRCFSEFLRYAVRLDSSFLVTRDGGVLTDRVRIDPDTGECVEDPDVSRLLTSRLRLGADEAQTFGHPVWGIPDCTNPDAATPLDANPCRITTPRGDGNSRFHAMTYEGEPVAAIRWSNPHLSLVIDLVSLLDLAQPMPQGKGAPWPLEFARFRRSRIPREYSIGFNTEDGYVPLHVQIVVNAQVPLVSPTRIINGPEHGVNFVVDAGGLGGVSGVRGQVVRVVVDQGEPTADNSFLVQ